MDFSDSQNPKIAELLNVQSQSVHPGISKNIDENSNISEGTERSSTKISCDGPASLIPDLQNLNIESPKDEDPSSLYYGFGKVENVVGKMGLVLIQSIKTDILVDIDTPVFISPSPEEEYKLLGEIDDIFGSIGKPMYSVRLTSGVLEELHLIVDSLVYLRLDHPDTSVLHVENVGDEKYNVVSKQQGP